MGTTIARRDPTEHDVQIEILLCGICHSDLHSVRNEWSELMPATEEPFGAGLQEQASNSRKLLSSNGSGCERYLEQIYWWHQPERPRSPGRAWRENLFGGDKGKGTSGEAESTDPQGRDGLSRSSDEAG